MLVRRECFERLGTFRADLSTCNDYDMCLKISRHYPIVCMSDIVAIYRRHNSNVTNRKVDIRINEMQVRKDLLNKNLTHEEKSLVREVLSKNNRELYAMAAQAFDKRNYREAARCYWAAIKRDRK